MRTRRRNASYRCCEAEQTTDTFQLQQENNVMQCLGYASVPNQVFDDRNISSFDEGLENGTIFPCLYLTLAEYGNVCKCRGGIS